MDVCALCITPRELERKELLVNLKFCQKKVMCLFVMSIGFEPF